ncbi:MAG: GNAT family N-acetyltransferase [Acidaminococcus sp.]|jgi:RimJ/RimL family protein N-acetyltransferase|nr:GNAT family N-acetyltransferase [Acidaminococcus sp.]MCI2100974.1 GNAT family N-acetyltransferase [Acidaminococcus sp.]MCI2115317.1 GNAT family N-acetyltransferase [Acidaminococcus sp.]MCI2117385.1 GNAT family N-acetyltransferase [Acidaminococcus sp.]
MELVKATKKDAERIMDIINQAKAFLKGQGVDQWQTGYPAMSDIEKDLNDGIGYVLKDEGKIIGYAGIDSRGEEAYDTLKGSWLNSDPYIVIHRMAVDNSVRGKGLAQKMFEACEDFALSQGIHNIRVDTDEDNHIMRHIIDKMGYQYTGTIWFDNSTKIAFQKVC